VCLLAAVGIARGQTVTETVLHNFGIFSNGANPYGTLTINSSRDLYGTTYLGGTANLGTVFACSAAGQYTVLHSFQGGTTDGSGPYAGVAFDAEGNLYGTTYGGGVAGLGVVYKVSASGQETVVHSFTGGADGSGPYAGVAIDAKGNLYGTTYNGGTANAGVVYKINSLGQETVLYTFTGGNDGANPYAGVTLDSSGNLYGTTYAGGPYNNGVIYKVNPAGRENVLYIFATTPQGGVNPQGGVILDSAGNLYGAVWSVVYKLSPAGQYTILASLHYGNYGGYTSPGTVAMDSAGNLYGTTDQVQQGTRSPAPDGAAFKVSPTGEVTLLYPFPGASQPDTLENGSEPGPNPGVVLDSAGNVYGDTPYSSVSGSIYKVDTGGTETTLHGFTGTPGGTDPNCIRVTSGGEIYGTTFIGGVANVGTVYRMDVAGHETVLYSFKGDTDGANPATSAPPAVDAAGNVYGTTYHGGTANMGIVFKVSPSGLETVLHSFTGGADGSDPQGGVILDSAGNLYGTTTEGGTGGLTGAQEGVVYKMSPTGQETVLYSFTGLSDGGTPSAGVIRDSEGNLYGTTFYGGAFNGGVVYKLTPSGQETVLYSFAGETDGADPVSGVLRDSGGNLYGTNVNYGAGGAGVLYKLDTAGDLTVLHSFSAGSGGYEPQGVVLDPAGNLYGTTELGGGSGCYMNWGCGVVYEVDTAGNYTVILTFAGGASGDGGSITLSPTGTLYGNAGLGTEAGGMIYQLALE
jgi:uncharacterized repeat protein (TIGR03803 family)